MEVVCTGLDDEEARRNFLSSSADFIMLVLDDLS